MFLKVLKFIHGGYYFRLSNCLNCYSPNFCKPKYSWFDGFIHSRFHAYSRLSRVIRRTMPKGLKKPKGQLRHTRLKAKAAATYKKFPNTFVLTSLGNGGKGNPRCLFISTDHSSYIFNCGEGAQRLASEHKLKLSKLEHIFFTYKSWDNIGGLPGLSLTIESIGVPSITLHGPADIKEIYSLNTNILFAKSLKVFYEHPEEDTFSDEYMSIRNVLLCSTGFLHNVNKDLEANETGAETDHISSSYERELKRPRVPISNDLAVAYICRLPNKPGELSVEKCVQYNVPPGPLLGLLKKGEDVTLSNGQVVKSSDVVSPEKPGTIFIVLECPSEDFLDSLTSAEAFKEYQTSSCKESLLAVVVHFSSPEVIANPRYQEWMKKFPDSAYHMILNSDCSSLSSIGIHRNQTMLHMVHPQIFPNLKETTQAKFLEENSMIIYADTMLRLRLLPHLRLDRSAVVKLEPKAYLQEATENELFMESLAKLNDVLSKNVSTCSNDDDCSSTQEEDIVFLGTGSSIPSKVRNVTAILYNIDSERSILLDCGEGTYNQMVRFYGQENANDMLSRIKLIFLSHKHVDHHMGLFQVIKKREISFQERNEPYVPVDIVASIEFDFWFQQYHNIFEPILHLINFIPCQSLVFKHTNLPEDKLGSVLQKLKLHQLNTVYVRHCKNAFGLILTTSNNWKLVYSGDTMPCEDLVDAGQCCSLLIHEATMEDNLEVEAMFKSHSTTSQAIEIGKKMNADFTMLTHFSQRYAKIPLFNENFHNGVGYSFDFMRVTREDLSILPLLFPSLKNLFFEHYREMQKKTHKKLHQHELLNQMAS